MAVPADLALAAVRECAESGVGACILITAQFAEMGEEGARRQAEIVRVARERGMRLLGPNCLGYVNPQSRTAMSSTLSLSAISTLPAGGIGVVSQSGALMGSLIAVGEETGAGFSACVSVGDQCDLELADFVEYMADDPATRAICLYVEGLLSTDRFLAAVDRARANGKPVLMAKAGRTESGARAVKSHTASLAGSHAVLEAVCEAHGVVLMDDAFDMLAVAHCMSRLGRVQGDGIAVFSGSGGGNALLADALSDHGCGSPTCRAATRDRLGALMPQSHCHLPIDVGVMREGLGSPGYGDAIASLLGVVMADPDVAAGIHLLTTQPNMEEVARSVGRASGESRQADPVHQRRRQGRRSGARRDAPDEFPLVRPAQGGSARRRLAGAGLPSCGSRRRRRRSRRSRSTRCSRSYRPVCSTRTRQSACWPPPECR